jgi:hypothetical protein
VVGWSEVATEGLEIHSLRGSHVNYSTVYMGAFTEMLSKSLRAAQTNCS